LKTASPELRGLVALLVSYLVRGSMPYRHHGPKTEGGEKPDDRQSLQVSKQIAPVMARTDFARVFGLLPQAEQTPFVENPTLFVDLVLQAAALPDGPVFQTASNAARTRRSISFRSNEVNGCVTSPVPGHGAAADGGERALCDDEDWDADLPKAQADTGAFNGALAALKQSTDNAFSEPGDDQVGPSQLRCAGREAWLQRAEPRRLTSG
jgi:hypothetical protein